MDRYIVSTNFLGERIRNNMQINIDKCMELSYAWSYMDGKNAHRRTKMTSCFKSWIFIHLSTSFTSWSWYMQNLLRFEIVNTAHAYNTELKFLHVQQRSGSIIIIIQCYFYNINNRIDSYELQRYFFLLLYNVQKLNKILFLFLLRRRMHACMVATMMIKNADNKAIEIANKLHRK